MTTLTTYQKCSLGILAIALAGLFYFEYVAPVQAIKESCKYKKQQVTVYPLVESKELTYKKCVASRTYILRARNKK